MTGETPPDSATLIWTHPPANVGLIRLEWNGSNVASFTVKVSHYPMFFTHLNGPDIQAEKFSPAQTASHQKCQHGIVPFASQILSVRFRQQTLALINGEPVANAHANSTNALYASNAGCQLWAEESGNCGFVRNSPNGREPQIDCRRGKVPFLQIDSVAKHSGPISAKRGSEQYQSTNSSIAWAQERCPLFEVNVLRTANLVCSSSGSASVRFGGFFLRFHKRAIDEMTTYSGSRVQLREPVP